MDLRVARYCDRPELWDQIPDLSSEVWPEYNMHGDVLNQYWGDLYDVFPQWQFVLYDGDSAEVLAEGHTIPVGWGGTDADLGPGIDATIAAGFERHSAGLAPTALSAMAAEIPRRNQGKGLATPILRAMAGLARDAGLTHLIAPVRPSFKERYPTIPIDRYVRWTGADGEPFDPWIRVHVRLGARIGPVLPESMRITGTVAEWEAWTGLTFPETGEYVFPAGLAPVLIDRERDAGEYWEPNVWLIHPIRAG
jgi:hypothetical protein